MINMCEIISREEESPLDKLKRLLRLGPRASDPRRKGRNKAMTILLLAEDPLSTFF
jgi:hypothetical protein